jgi:BMFP domain-containing protein YqiC
MVSFRATTDVAERFETYEDYLDSQLTSTDLAYLDDEEMARQLVELGYRGLGDTIRREDFDARKRMLLERSTQKSNAPRQLASLDKNLNDSPFLLVRGYTCIITAFCIIPWDVDGN